MSGTRILRVIHGRVEHPSGAAPPGTPHARATLMPKHSVIVAEQSANWQVAGELPRQIVGGRLREVCGLAGERTFVSFGAAVLCKLNNEGRGGHEQKGMDHAAFMQQKRRDQPKSRYDGAYDPEHFEIDSLVV